MALQLDYIKHVQQAPGAVQAVLDACPDPECALCATLACPHFCELHFHHDGCPACAEMEKQPR